MPNWCNCRLEVYGPETEVDKFKDSDFQIGQNTEVLKSPEMITYSFQNAWDPPAKYVGQISEQFPLLNFDLYYYEWTTMFAGALEYRRGKLHRDEHIEGNDDAVQAFVWEAFSTDINLLQVQ